jgi:hypothetical protein
VAALCDNHQGEELGKCGAICDKYRRLRSLLTVHPSFVSNKNKEKIILNMQYQSSSVSNHTGQTAYYNVFLPVLQFSPVNIIPPMLHTHSFIYHLHCIMFFSQYFSFPLSVSYHQCSILIHLYVAFIRTSGRSLGT